MSFGKSLANCFVCCSLMLACADEAATVVPSRVVAVAAAETEGESADTFCEVHGLEAPSFEWPAGVESSAEGWRWVNVWATWCRPCVEEMPRLLDFQRRLTAEGIEVTTVFLNADSDDAAYEAFVEGHAYARGARVASTEVLQAWMGARGLDAGAPLPSHFFVRPDGSLACARSAAVGDDDFASVRRLLRSE